MLADASASVLSAPSSRNLVKVQILPSKSLRCGGGSVQPQASLTSLSPFWALVLLAESGRLQRGGGHMTRCCRDKRRISQDKDFHRQRAKFP